MLASRSYRARLAVIGAALMLFVLRGSAQPPPQQQAATAADHQRMKGLLGIKALRPGPSGNESAPNHANYDEALANPYPDLPKLLTMENGRTVTTADAWWKQRRPEIVEAFDREVVGRVPAGAPEVSWRVNRSDRSDVAGHAVLTRDLIGAADNSAHPAITVEIQMTIVTPAAATRPVPLMMMFGRANPTAICVRHSRKLQSWGREHVGIQGSRRGRA